MSCLRTKENVSRPALWNSATRHVLPPRTSHRFLMKDLKEKTIRGGSVRLFSQVAVLLLRVGSLALLARLLNPTDFGLVSMVTAFTGVLNLFRDFGLSAATVQRASVTEQETSTLFWINVLVGAVLTGLAMLFAPAVASFYHEPRLFLVTAAVAPGFLFNALGVQHSALLQRQMRFTALASIDLISLIISTVTAIVMAKFGYGYWALVAMTVSLPLISTVGLWLVARWVPGRPRRQAGLLSMMRFGGTLTLNGLVLYISTNLEKVLLGRFWGAEAIGIYGRAFQLSKIPTDNLNSAVGQVAFSALSRVQDDPARLRRYFLKGYSLVLALNIPITMSCAFFADDIIRLLLGPKWAGAAVLLRILSPTILVFTICNPLGWLLDSLGLVARGLKIALVFAPVMIAGILVGLPYGPKGVAIAYSTVMMLWVVPVAAWAVHGTMISFMDIVTTVKQPLLSGLVAAALALGVRVTWGEHLTMLPRLVLEGTVLLGAYAAMLLYVMGQKSFYLDLLRKSSGRPVVTEVAVP
jgi:O-antigen/teichoic acid export membrane protein